MAFLDTIMWPFSWAVSFILSMWHSLLSLMGLPEGSGWNWAISILLLVLVIRIILIPLFVRQIKSQRGMQIIQPEIQKLQAKYKGKKDPVSRQAMAQEQQALFKKHKVNPFMTCLPILAQMPIFLALFWCLNRIGGSGQIGTGDTDYQSEGYFALSGEEVTSFANSRIFGVGMPDTFLGATQGDPALMGSTVTVIALTSVMIILMVGTQFFTQKQLMQKNMSEAALKGQFAQTQKIMLYALPLVFVFGGVYFPVGVLIYWTATNFWTMGQQWWVIRNNPTPGSMAEKELNLRRAAKGLPPVGEEARKAREEAAKPKSEHKGHTAQPKKKKKKKKKKKGQR
ncbi:membrane protein insertase YidC [Nesterenkonia alkaliphila]|uniref:Membrane protein insertase YidC n=1 Tax=Nesterenkonia alkaliphila TaxID=1463631 RepID=A0A7K1UG38_9MICC|nr:membrane protein insertase YidC [Nesterenkonia alkaliphila]MVT25409.1 membrane protein insertase YidC [Nesterenkonia alkaliphila]GFZ83311.1 membrane protein insertase YidC [Nesterenkonia alkaliphila]